MFLKIGQATEFEKNIHNFFQYYYNDIMQLYQKFWFQESIYDKSCIQYQINQYNGAIILLSLISYEVNEGIQTDWSYYIDKYKLDDKAKILACNNISLKKGLEIFGLNTAVNVNEIVDNNAVEYAIVENTLIVEPSDTTSDIIVDISDLLALEDNCYNLLDDSTITELVSVVTDTGGSSGGSVVNATYYYGTYPNATISESNILALTSANTTSLNLTLSFGAGDYKYVAIPISLGTPTNFIDDDTEFEVAIVDLGQLTVDGVLCNVYRTYYPLGSTITIKIT